MDPGLFTGSTSSHSTAQHGKTEAMMTKMFAPNAQAGAAPKKAEPNPPSAAPASAAPTATDKKAKERVKYPVPAEGLLEWPADHDREKHKPLQKNDFKDPIVFLNAKLKQAEDHVNKIKEEIEDVKKNGPGGANKAAKLQKVQSELSALMEALKGQGVDVESIMKAHRENQAKAASAS